MATIGQGIITLLPEGDLVLALSSLAENGGGVLNLLAGTYNATSNLMVGSNIRIVGVGSSGTIIDFGNQPYQLQIVGDNPYIDGTATVAKGDILVSGDTTAWTQDMVGQSIFLSGIWYIIDSVDSDLQQITIDIPYSGTNLSGSIYAIATPNTSASINGFTVQNSSIEAVKAQYCQNFGGSDILSFNALAGVLFDYMNTLNWTIGYVDTCGTGMILSNMGGSTVQNSFVTNATSGGGYIFSNCNNSVMINSSIDGCVGPGLQLNNISNFGVEELSIINIIGNGIEINGGGNAVVITSGLVDSATLDGLYISGSESRVQITANQFSNNGGYGVNISSGSSDNLFLGNSFFDNTSGAANDMGTNTLIRSNVGLADN